MGHFAVQGIFLAPRQKPCLRCCSELRHCPCCVCGRKTFGEAGVTRAQWQFSQVIWFVNGTTISILQLLGHHFVSPYGHRQQVRVPSEHSARTRLFLQEHQPPGAGVHTTITHLQCSVSDGQWVQCPLPPAH